MRRFGLLLILLALFLVACGSGGSGTETAEQIESEEPAVEATTAPATNESAETPTTEAAPQQDQIADAPAAGLGDDPAQVRERDWRQGNTTDPAVTIIEYGDFQ